MAGGEKPPAEWPPDLLPGADELLSAFWELSSDRQLGMSAGPIPYTAIDRWALRNNVEPEGFPELLAAIRAMDAEWLSEGGASIGKDTPAPQVSTRPMSPELFGALFQRAG